MSELEDYIASYLVTLSYEITGYFYVPFFYFCIFETVYNGLIVL